MRKRFMNSKIKGLILVAALCLCLTAAALAASLSYPFMTVVTDNVNMRSTASSSAVIRERISKGEQITVTGESGSYFKVSYRNRTGYVLKSYVDTSKESMVIPTPDPATVVYGYPYEAKTVTKAPMLAKREANAKVLKNLAKGSTVTVTKVTGTYAWITVDGVDGFTKLTNLESKTVCTATPAPTATPFVDAVGSDGDYRDLKKGDSGAAVVALQNALKELDYYTGACDGNFGKETESAVFAFQETNGMVCDGVMTAIAQGQLYSGKVKARSGKEAAVNQLAPISGVTVRKGATGELVSAIQQKLTDLGYYAGAVNGVYDDSTQQAVKDFQKKNGLKVDGVAGVETQTAIFADYSVTAYSDPTPVPTAEPTAVPDLTTPSASVKKGSTGANAKLVQKRLKELGYYKGKVDGNFGADSVKALKAFQTKAGLEADGAAGKETYAKLFDADAIPASATPTPSPDPLMNLNNITEENVVTIRKNSTGTAVSNLQQRLVDLGYYTGPVDGKIKSADVEVIKAFQKANGLKADGVAGFETQSKMFSLLALTPAGTVMNAAGAAEQVTYTMLKKGMTGDAVKALQNQLIKLGYLTGKADGNYGTATATAVYNFQKASGLSRDGVAGVLTQTALFAANAPAKATATPKPTEGSSVLKSGDVSDAVKTLQNSLIKLGYMTGKADGKFGTKTMEALKKFQKAAGLKADGVAGAQTMTAVDKALVAAGQTAAAATPTPTPDPNASASFSPDPAKVRYANWYTTVKTVAKNHPYATIYDFSTGISWQVHIFSLGAHADAEPLTAADTAKMEKAFGGNTWNPKSVWVIFSDGTQYMASTHSMPHEVQHRKDNNFDGHICIHFPRTDAQVAAIGPYATSHQTEVDAGWAKTQGMIRK